MTKKDDLANGVCYLDDDTGIDLEEGEIETDICFYCNDNRLCVMLSICDRRRVFEPIITEIGCYAELWEQGFYRPEEEGYWEYN